MKKYEVDYNRLLEVKEIELHWLDKDTLISYGITIGSDEYNEEVYAEIEVWLD